MRIAGTLTQETLEAHRHKHLAYILNEQAQLNNGNNSTISTNLNKVCFMMLDNLICCFSDVLCFSERSSCFCGYLGGEEAVAAQEVHIDISAVWGR